MPDVEMRDVDKRYEEGLKKLVSSQFASRLFEKDASLWGSEAKAEAATRLGWIDAIATIQDTLALAQQLNTTIKTFDIDRILLCGMGGSTLAAQLLSASFGGNLIALDTTHPSEVESALSASTLARTLVIVSTKSGSTVETLAQLDLTLHRLEEEKLDPKEHLLIITDPNTPLHQKAMQLGCQYVLGDEHVGGRFSALTVYGIVPAILAGAKLDSIVADVPPAAAAFFKDEENNLALIVASKIHAKIFSQDSAEYTAQFIADERIELLPSWIEQLIAESIGKSGHGLLPLPRSSDEITAFGGFVVKCITDDASSYELEGVKAEITVRANLTVQILFWEVVTVAIAFLLQVNPFDQPDVERTKESARKMRNPGLSIKLNDITPNTSVADKSEYSKEPSLKAAMQHFLADINSAPYIVLQAFVIETAESVKTLKEYANFLEKKTRKPVALSFGPKFLHSTGQMHKGGPAGIAVMQLSEILTKDLEVPGEKFSFGDLQNSWLIADREVHTELGNSVLSLQSTNIEATVAELKQALNY